MDLKVDYEEIKKSVRVFEDEYDLLYYVKDQLDWLYRHNKNYNNWQWITIQNLKDIFDNISIKEK